MPLLVIGQPASPRPLTAVGIRLTRYRPVRFYHADRTSGRAGAGDSALNDLGVQTKGSVVARPATAQAIARADGRDVARGDRTS